VVPAMYMFLAAEHTAEAAGDQTAPAPASGG